MSRGLARRVVNALYLSPSQTTIMKRGCDERSRNTGILQRSEVGNIAHAAGRIDFPRRCRRTDGAKALEVGARTAADPRERHRLALR